MLTLEKSTVKSDTLFWKGGLIVMWLLSVQGLHSNSEGLNTDFKSDLISEPLWYHFFYWFDILSARDSLMRVCSHGLFFLTHAFGKFTCLVFILWFTMVIFFLYLMNRCDNTPYSFKEIFDRIVQLGRNCQNPFYQDHNSLFNTNDTQLSFHCSLSAG